MWTFIHMLISILFALSLSACGNVINTQQEKKELVGPRWVVQSFQDADGTKSNPGTVTLSVRFFYPDLLIGKADNEFSGKFSVNGNALSIRIQGTTLIGRAPGSREQDFMDALNGASFYEIEGNQLRVYYFGKTRVLNLLADQ